MDLTDQELKELAKVVKYMAETGKGTDYCLMQGCLPMTTHFYSPIPDVQDLERRKIWETKSDLPGLDMRADYQLLLLKEMAQIFAKECNWPEHPTANPHQFHWRNNCFSFQCASLLHYMIRYYKPGRIVEIGSGLSSRVVNSAIDINKSEGTSCIYEIVDPYAAETTKTLPNLSSVIIQKVELTDINFYKSLNAGDFLFIDSGHVVKTAADVNFLILEVLPRLAPGVFIHFHDIPMPHEYTESYFKNPDFRVFWTESYLLQAFLAFNSDFYIVAAAAFISSQYPTSLKNIFPNDPKNASSGSFWIRRCLK